MRDRPLIVAGLVLFLGLVTFPVWYNVAARTDPGAPALARPSATGVGLLRRGEPARVSASALSCVAPREYMRASHMTLLAQWCEDVDRRGDRSYVAYDGHRYEKSFTGTCLTCHDNKAQFCDRCHNYAGVSPTCTDCHVTPMAPGSRLQAPGAIRLQQEPSAARLQPAASRLPEAWSRKPGARAK
jgi:hypothetical protein